MIGYDHGDIDGACKAAKVMEFFNVFSDLGQEITCWDILDKVWPARRSRKVCITEWIAVFEISKWTAFSEQEQTAEANHATLAVFIRCFRSPCSRQYAQPRARKVIYRL